MSLALLRLPLIFGEILVRYSSQGARLSRSRFSFHTSLPPPRARSLARVISTRRLPAAGPAPPPRVASPPSASSARAPSRSDGRLGAAFVFVVARRAQHLVRRRDGRARAAGSLARLVGDGGVRRGEVAADGLRGPSKGDAPAARETRVGGTAPPGARLPARRRGPRARRRGRAPPPPRARAVSFASTSSTRRPRAASTRAARCAARLSMTTRCARTVSCALSSRRRSRTSAESSAPPLPPPPPRGAGRRRLPTSLARGRPRARGAVPARGRRRNRASPPARRGEAGRREPSRARPCLRSTPATPDRGRPRATSREAPRATPRSAREEGSGGGERERRGGDGHVSARARGEEADGRRNQQRRSGRAPVAPRRGTICTPRGSPRVGACRPATSRARARARDRTPRGRGPAPGTQRASDD